MHYTHASLVLRFAKNSSRYRKINACHDRKTKGCNKNFKKGHAIPARAWPDICHRDLPMQVLRLRGSRRGGGWRSWSQAQAALRHPVLH